MAEVYMPGLLRRPLVESTPIIIYAFAKKGRAMSNFSDYVIRRFRKELSEASDHLQKQVQK